MVSRVVTFYSYKGGVGRSMAMANIGVLLAQWGYKTLVIDWDLEAPGLENYYKDFLDLQKVMDKEGLIDILKLKVDYHGISAEKIEWDKYITPVHIHGQSNLSLITAG